MTDQTTSPADAPTTWGTLSEDAFIALASAQPRTPATIEFEGGRITGTLVGQCVRNPTPGKPPEVSFIELTIAVPTDPLLTDAEYAQRRAQLLADDESCDPGHCPDCEGTGLNIGGPGNCQSCDGRPTITLWDAAGGAR